MLAVVVSILGAPAAVSAANDLCGQTIMQNVTFTADQICGSGEGITVGASGVTIDLAGFTLQGSGFFGIFVAGPTGVTIKNGTVRGFEHAVTAATQGLKLSNLVVRDATTFGGDFSGIVSIDRCAFIGNELGLRVTLFSPEESAVVTNSAFVGNLDAGIDLAVLSSGKATLKNVVAAGNTGDGIKLRTDAEGGTTLSGSTVAANGGMGITMGSQGVTVVQKTRVTGNALVGIETQMTRFASLLGNTVDGNGQRGILVRNGSQRVTVAKNRVTGNGNDGIAVDNTSASNIVKGNTVVGNGNDGIETLSTSTELTKNLAVGNDALGIFALSGAIDGGGNAARWNGSPLECSGFVACPPVFVPKAGAVSPTCGMVVTSSITLGADMFCAGLPGLIIDADGVTINLNGHRLDGDRSAGPIGIDVQGHARVTIKNGIVRGFDRGIVSHGSAGLKLVNVAVRDSLGQGVDVDGTDIKISKSAFITNSGDGIHLGDGTVAPQIGASFLVGNGGDGLESHATRLSARKLTATVNTGRGIRLSGTDGATLQGSTMANNGGEGVRVEIPLSSAVVKANTIVGNQDEGIAVTAQGAGHAVVGNTVGGNGGHGIALFGASTANTIAKNTAVGNASAGIFVDVAPGATTVSANKTTANGGYGILVGAAAGTLVKNLAVANLLNGIVTPFGAVDGGGNAARDNGTDPQCGPPIACP